MKRLLILAITAIAALAVAAPAMAAAPTLFGGATQEGNVIKLLSQGTSPAGINFPDDIKFEDLKVLAAEYNVTDDGCGGGSPRFQLQTASGPVFVYVGPTPSFTGCDLNTWLSTGNLIGSTDARFDLSKVGGGGTYVTYEQARAFLGSTMITSIQFVIDSGWFFADQEQTVLVRNVIVNGTVAGGTITNGRLNPAQACRAMRTAMNAASPTLFATTFGTNANRRNAFGKRVSMMAHAKKTGSLAAIQLLVLNAVASCRAAGHTGAALTQCVLQQIRPTLTTTAVAAATAAKQKAAKEKAAKEKAKGGKGK